MTDHDDLHEQMTRELARQVGALEAQKLKLSQWLAKALLANGGVLDLYGQVPLTAHHLLTEHVCRGIGHGPECHDHLELHAGLVEDCLIEGCARLRHQPKTGPGVRSEYVEPTPARPRLRKSDQQRLLEAEAKQHPRWN